MILHIGEEVQDMEDGTIFKVVKYGKHSKMLYDEQENKVLRLPRDPERFLVKVTDKSFISKKTLMHGINYDMKADAFDALRYSMTVGKIIKLNPNTQGEETMNSNKTVAKVFSNNTEHAILVFHSVGHESAEGSHKDCCILKNNKAAVLKHVKELAEETNISCCN